jgi:hydroxypyruvate reductase
LARYDLTQKVPPAVLKWLQAGASGHVADTPKPGDPVFANVTNMVIASNVTAVEAAAARARDMGFDTLIASTYLEGEAREAGRVLAAVAKEVAAYARPVNRHGCVLFGGETTVTVRGSGIGGRNSELALGAALALDGWGPDLVVASLATDGGDGTSPVAGAVADGTTISRARALGLDAHAALARNDSYTFWAQLGDAIITGPTGTNVNDVMAVFVF